MSMASSQGVYSAAKGTAFHKGLLPKRVSDPVGRESNQAPANVRGMATAAAARPT